MKNKIKKKYCLIGLVALLFVVFFVYFLMQNYNNQRKDEITYFINDKQAKTLKIDKNFGENVNLSPSSFKLMAKNGLDENVTKQIKYKERKLEELGTYKIVYSVKGKENTFTLIINILDKEAPVFEGNGEIEWDKGVAFDYSLSSLGISLKDNHDQDLSQSVKYEESVNINEVGTYLVVYEVCDISKNCSSFTLKVNVNEKVLAVDQGNNGNDLFGDPRLITPRIATNPDDLQVLINKRNALPVGWGPSDLVAITSNNGREMFLRSAAAANWEALNSSANANGLSIKVVSSFRTATYQEGLFYGYLISDGDSAFLYSALPRRSEHELGLAIDISYDGTLHHDLLNSEVGQFMYNEAHKYGFILRYPYDKTHITGYGFEPWHYRYVGVDLATMLKQSNLTLDEYYN